VASVGKENVSPAVLVEYRIIQRSAKQWEIQRLTIEPLADAYTEETAKALLSLFKG
jgi:hypothetical protein